MLERKRRPSLFRLESECCRFGESDPRLAWLEWSCSNAYREPMPFRCAVPHRLSRTLRRRLSGVCLSRQWAQGLWLGLALSCAPPAANPPAGGPSPERSASESTAPTERAAPTAEADDLRPLLQRPGSKDEAVRQAVAAFDRLAANGTRAPKAQAFIDRHESLLVGTYVDDHESLSAPTRLSLINLLVSFDRPAARPAYAAAIRRYAESGEGTDEAIWAARAATRHSGSELRSALLYALRHIDLSTDDGKRFSVHLTEALLHNVDPVATPALIELAHTPLERPERFDDHAGTRRFQNQLYKTQTSVKLLGETGSSDAARALVTLLLDSTKHSIHPDAEVALLRLGAAALPPLRALLEGDSALAAAAQQQSPDLAEPHVHWATRWLDLLRHPSSEEMLRDAWPRARSAQSRAALARSLCLLPAVDASSLLQKAYAETPVTATFPQGESALEALAEHAAYLYDPALVPWLAQRVTQVPVRWGRTGDVQRTLVTTMTHVMDETHVKAATATAMRYGGRTATPYFVRSRELLSTCQRSADCYLQAMSDARSDIAVGLKSAFMIAITGGASHRDALIEKLPTLPPDVLSAALAAIEEMTPTRGEATARLLERVASSNPSTPEANQRMRQTAQRLAARQ